MISDAGYILKDSLVSPWPCRGDRLRWLELKLRYEVDWSKVGAGDAADLAGLAGGGCHPRAPADVGGSDG